MQLYHTLPATDYRWSTSPIHSIRRLRSEKQSAFNQLVLARFELIRLMAFSSVECAIHSAAAAAKFTVAVIQFPLCPVFGGVTSRVAFIDACSHTVLSIKLAMAIICIPALGSVRPEWSISLYQKCGIVNLPKGMIVRAIDRIHTTATAGWASCYRHDVLFGAALAGAALLGNKISRPWHAASAGRVLPSVLLGLCVLPLGAALSILGRVNQLFPEKPRSEKPKIRRGGPTTISDLPNAQLLQIMNCLKPRELVAMMLSQKIFTHVAINDNAWRIQCNRRVSAPGEHQKLITKLSSELQGWAHLRLFRSWVEKKEPWRCSKVPYWPRGKKNPTTTMLSNGTFLTLFKDGFAYIWTTGATRGRMVPGRLFGAPTALKQDGRFIACNNAACSYTCCVFDANGERIKDANGTLYPSFSRSGYRFVTLQDGGFLIFEPLSTTIERRDRNGILAWNFTHIQRIGSIDELENGNLIIISVNALYLDSLYLWVPKENSPKILQEDVEIAWLTVLSDGFATGSQRSEKIVRFWNTNGTQTSQFLYTGKKLFGITELSNSRYAVYTRGLLLHILERNGSTTEVIDLGSHCEALPHGGFYNQSGACVTHCLADGSVVAQFLNPNPAHHPFLMSLSDSILIGCRDESAPLIWSADISPLLGPPKRRCYHLRHFKKPLRMILPVIKAVAELWVNFTH